MIHRAIDLCFELLARYWLLGLVLCSLAFILVLMLILRSARKNSKRTKHSPQAQARHGNLILNSLSRLSDKYICLHELYVPRLDGNGTTKIHHAVLSRFGVFVIQVQHECGDISGDAESREWQARQKDTVRSFTNPVLRNQYHLKALAKYLDAPEALFHSLIVFDSAAQFEDSPPPQVLKEGIGRAIISHTSEIISPAMLEKMTRVLRETCVRQEQGAHREDHTKARIKRLRHTPERSA